ncbi:Modification methylase HindIII [Corynebacterium auriscanis]|nr:Modification methylase HindIII [Corynebacterium auriscanis]
MWWGVMMSPTMKIEHSFDNVCIVNDDYRNHLNQLHQAHVLITDPPYGMKYRGHGNKHKPITGDNTTHARDELITHWGTTKPAMIFGTWRVPKPQCRNTIAWIKTNTGPGMGALDLPWGSAWEEIYILGKGFYTPHKRQPNHTHINAYPSGSKQRPNHPTPKPVELMEWLIQHCPPDWTIIDPFAGSGATLRAARNLGRTAIGFEIDPDHTQTAVNLLQQDQEKDTPP